jgi:predicted dehydrogenase
MRKKGLTMTVNFGIVGFGKMAEICHMGLIRKTPGAKLLAVWDITESRRQAAAQAGIPRIYGNFAKLLADPDIHAVSICTPSHSHVKLGLLAAKAGKHILVEKPAARTAAEFKKLLAACRKAGVKLTVFHNRRYDADFLAARDIIRKKLIGDIVTVETRWHMYGSTSGFAVKDYKQNWRDLKAFGGGFLMDLGVHLLDQLNQLTPAKPTEVFATLRNVTFAKEVDDYVTSLIRFDNGMTAVMETGALMKVKIPRWRLIGSKGMAVGNWQTKTFELYIGDTDKPTKVIPLGETSARWVNVYKGFVAAIKDSRKAPAVTPESVVTTMDLIEACRTSSRTGKSVTLRGPRAK